MRFLPNNSTVFKNNTEKIASSFSIYIIFRRRRRRKTTTWNCTFFADKILQFLKIIRKKLLPVLSFSVKTKNNKKTIKNRNIESYIFCR